MKVITFYSDSHKEMYENFFLTSFNHHMGDYQLISKKINQLSPTGTYESQGFDWTMVEKLDLIIDNINQKEINYLLYSDCDVQFFNKLTFELEDFDILFQQDATSLCAGFFVCKQTKKVLDFFIEVKQVLIQSMNGKIHDQTIINQFHRNGYNKIKIGVLPKNEFWTIANSINNRIWTEGVDFEIPSEIKVHHANFTIGIDNKMSLLNLVKDKYKKLT